MHGTNLVLIVLGWGDAPYGGYTRTYKLVGRCRVTPTMVVGATTQEIVVAFEHRCVPGIVHLQYTAGVLPLSPPPLPRQRC